MGGMLAEDPEELAGELPPEMRSAMSALTGGLGALGGLGQMMRSIGGMMVGGQTGAAVGALAQEVVSSTDVGLPLGPAGTAALLPAGVSAFGQGLSVDEDEVRLFLALREAAHHRLFAHVPWLRARLLGAVEDYARGIAVDADALRQAMPQIDPANPEALNEALAGAALFQPEDTEQQKAALARLETVLALVEGWVATVVDSAAAEPAAAGRRPGRGDQAAPGHGRPGRADVRDAGRPGVAAAAAARGRGDLAWPDRRPRQSAAGKRSGPTPTCCPRRTISTIRTDSSRVAPDSTSQISNPRAARRSPSPRPVGPRTASPKATTPRTATPATATPRAASPRTARPATATPKAASPRTANRPTAPEPRPQPAVP